jgi:adenine phosphoribosyltransferase
MRLYLSKIDKNTTGNRYDVTPLFADHKALAELVEDLAAPFRDVRLDFVACVDALGFILGTALAGRLALGVIPVRKGGKLPVAVDRAQFSDYSGHTKQLEIRKDSIPRGARVLLVDEWVETGAQIRAAATLVEGQGGIVAGIVAINMDLNQRTAEIRRRYRVHTVWPT